MGFDTKNKQIFRAYSQNTIKSLKTYNIIKSHAVHKYIIYNDNYKHIKTK